MHHAERTQAEPTEIHGRHGGFDTEQEGVGRPTELAAIPVYLRKMVHDEGSKGLVAGFLRQLKRALTRFEGLVVPSKQSETVGHRGADTALSASIPERLRDRLGLPQVLQRPPVLAQLPERRLRIQTEVQCQQQRLAALGQVRQPV